MITEQYQYYYASSGSTVVELFFYDNATFEIHFRYGWMGAEREERSLFGKVEAKHAHYGCLIVQWVIDNPERKIQLENFDTSLLIERGCKNLWEDLYHQELQSIEKDLASGLLEAEEADDLKILLVFEYLKVPPSEVMVIEDPNFSDRNWTFDLLLMLHEPEHLDSQRELSHFGMLDKIKMSKK